MGKATDKSNLGYLGVDFQYKLVKCFIEDPTFFPEISEIVESNSFTDSLLRTFVGTMVDYYKRENIVPSYDVMRIALRSKYNNTEIEGLEWDALIDKLKATTFEGYTLIKDNATKFFKQQRLLKAANKMIEKIGSGDIEHFDESVKLIQDALMVGSSNNYGHTIYELQEKALSTDYTISIPTGIKGLDKVLGGGLDKGKLGLIIGPLGFGKTTLATAFAAYASIYTCPENDGEGYKVMQIYFEDDDVDIARKHFAKITNIESSQFKRCGDELKSTVTEMLNKDPDRALKGRNLRIYKYPTGKLSASDIKREILKNINAGFKPDVVILDYFECLAPEHDDRSDSKWDRQENTMRTLENMAHELNIALWLPTQGNRDSLTAVTVTTDKAGGSITKGQIAQVILSVAKSIEQKQQGKATLALLKNRTGSDTAIWRDIKFNNGTCDIDCEDVEEVVDALAWHNEQERIKREDNNIMSAQFMSKNPLYRPQK